MLSLCSCFSAYCMSRPPPFSACTADFLFPPVRVSHTWSHSLSSSFESRLVSSRLLEATPERARKKVKDVCAACAWGLRALRRGRDGPGVRWGVLSFHSLGNEQTSHWMNRYVIYIHQRFRMSPETCFVCPFANKTSVFFPPLYNCQLAGPHASKTEGLLKRQLQWCFYMITLIKYKDRILRIKCTFLMRRIQLHTTSRFLPRWADGGHTTAGCSRLHDSLSFTCVYERPQHIWGLMVGRESVRWWKDREGWLQGRNEVALANCALVVDTGRFYLPVS